MKTVSGAALLLLASIHTAAAAELTFDDIFPTDRVLDVQITVPPADWNTIRRQSRNLFTALAASRKIKPIESPYTYVEASVTIDGVEFPKVGLRKKGFIGSLSTVRPSLKIKLNHVDPEAGIAGLKNLTFNNNKQDFTLVSQFMGYAFFNAVGSPAPRCAFANVTVNGKNLGIYSHVETVRKPFLRRGFGDDGGTLYEGTVVDFYDGWEGSFELKRGDDEAGRAKIKQLIDVMNGGLDSALLGSALLGAENEARAWVPTSDKHDATWTAPDFDDSGWKKGRGGAGYETGLGYKAHFSPEFDLGEEMFKKRESVYLRYRFQVDDPGKIDGLTLRMKYDDGFVAYLNGHRVASANAPREPRWNSRASGPNGDEAAVSFQPFDVSDPIDRVRKGVNVLALHGLNIAAESSDLLVAAELRTGGSSVDVEQAIGELLDLDAFYKFWAVEGLLGFWDGYSGNRNNFFFYLNPKTGKIHFAPWGADSLFVRFSMIDPDRSAPLSVKTQGLIAHKLYQQASGRARYRKTMLEILDKHWDEEKLLAETDRIEALLEPSIKASRRHGTFSRRLEGVRGFIRTRRDAIRAEIIDGMPIRTRTPKKPPLMPERGGFFGRPDK